MTAVSYTGELDHAVVDDLIHTFRLKLEGEKEATSLLAFTILTLPTALWLFNINGDSNYVMFKQRTLLVRKRLPEPSSISYS
ncbi:Uncharacterized protein HZ326_8234 [Fusarium oxysporum f. sp. albedinis]|nr:Uncharacterized protein HZ326_8234 [Fusarium oxysporum f. sp. albedinis]